MNLNHHLALDVYGKYFIRIPLSPQHNLTEQDLKNRFVVDVRPCPRRLCARVWIRIIYPPMNNWVWVFSNIYQVLKCVFILFYRPVFELANDSPYHAAREIQKRLRLMFKRFWVRGQNSGKASSIFARCCFTGFGRRLRLFL